MTATATDFALRRKEWFPGDVGRTFLGNVQAYPSRGSSEGYDVGIQLALVIQVVPSSAVSVVNDRDIAEWSEVLVLFSNGCLGWLDTFWLAAVP